jgi:Flp pilus assembly protein TadD
LLAGLAATLVWASRARKLAWLAALWVVPAVAIAQLEIPVWRDSQTVYETVRVRAPDSYKAHFLVGNLRVDAGRMAEASTEYATSIALFDADPQVLYAAGAHAMRMNDTPRALAWLGKSVDMDPKNRRARGSLIRIALATGDTTRARALLTGGLQREPEQRVWRALLDSLQR